MNATFGFQALLKQLLIVCWASSREFLLGVFQLSCHGLSRWAPCWSGRVRFVASAYVEEYLGYYISGQKIDCGHEHRAQARNFSLYHQLRARCGYWFWRWSLVFGFRGVSLFLSSKLYNLSTFEGYVAWLKPIPTTPDVQNLWKDFVFPGFTGSTEVSQKVEEINQNGLILLWCFLQNSLKRDFDQNWIPLLQTVHRRRAKDSYSKQNANSAYCIPWCGMCVCRV